MDRQAWVLQDRIEAIAVRWREIKPRERVRGEEDERQEAEANEALHAERVRAQSFRQIVPESRDGGAEQGWEQIAWVASTTARRGLAISLSGMMRDGDVTRDRAESLARTVLHDNAAAVYGLK